MGLIIKNGIRYFGDNTVQLTQAQYDALSQAEKLNGTIYYITDANNASASYAAGVTYDNTSSGLSATNVQSAIDEINSTTASLFYSKEYTYTAESVAANSSSTISKADFGIDDINGYIAIVATRIGVSKAGFAITSFNVRGVSSVLAVSNITNATITNTTFSIRIVFVKSNFLQFLT